MARPTKLLEDRLTERIKFDLRGSDFLAAIQAAEKAGMTLTGYARQQFLRGRVVIKQTRQLDYGAYDQLRRIGVNLNQIARKFHQSGKPPKELSRMCVLIEKYLKEHVDDDTGSHKNR